MRVKASDIEEWLAARIAERAGIAVCDVDRSVPFASYGLTSVDAVSLAGELQEWLGRTLPATLAYDYPTIHSLTLYLADPHARSTPGHEAAAARPREPVAIVGIGCRFPKASRPAEFWSLLRSGIDAIGEVPRDRWDIEALYDPDPKKPGKMSTRFGGFLDDIAGFDCQAFGISPREAALMDPQHRLLLEVTAEAIDDAGLRADTLAGSRSGVFIGISTNDYALLQTHPEQIRDAYGGTGNAFSIAANRISFFWDLRGPSLAIDTACSSSLAAVHLACRSIWSGESDMAIAGGVNLMISPLVTMSFSKAGMMAPDGRCKTFDARANGYVRGEGAGVVILKSLSRARRDGDRVYAVVMGSAVTQDGRTNGLTAPNQLAQEEVLRCAYADARVDPAAVTCVEVHGTGTALGDPIEVRALAAVMSPGRPAGRPCLVGSVKTNIGHLEASAGIAGLIKAALSAWFGEIPPSLHFESPNPNIPFDSIPIRVQTQLTEWTSEAPGYVGVSSFGFGGTNAHVVLRREHRPLETAETDNAAGPFLLPVSARCAEALSATIAAFRTAAFAAESRLYDFCYTAAVRRTHYPYRAAFYGQTAADLLRALNDRSPGAWIGSGRPAIRVPRMAVLFGGDPLANLGLTRYLCETWTPFRDALQNVASSFVPDGNDASSHPDAWSHLRPPLLLVAVHLAWVELLRSWGITAETVCGWNTGSLSAACAEGSLETHEIGVQGGGLMPLSKPTLKADCDDVLMLATEQERAALLASKPDCRVLFISPAGDGADVLRLISELWVSGYDLCWDSVCPRPGRHVSLPLYPWQRSRHWIPLNDGSSGASADEAEPESAATALTAEAVLRELINEIARTLGQAPERIDPGWPVTSLGFDSLMAVEFRHKARKRFRVEIPLARLLEGPTLLQLSELIVSLRAELDGAGDARATSLRELALNRPEELLARLDQLSGEEIETLVAQL